MELLTIPLLANTPVQFRKAGASFEIIDASAAIDVLFYSDTGGQIGKAKQALSGLFLNFKFGAFDLLSATAQSIVILVCDGNEGGGSRRQPGTVRVIDQGADKTAAGLQFYSSNQYSAFAANSTLIGLRATTLNVIVKRLFIVVPVAGTYALFTCTGDPTANPANYAGALVNKNLGGASSTARGLRGTSAAAAPTVGELPGALNMLAGMVIQAGLIELPLTTPLRLPFASTAGFVVVGPVNTAFGIIVDTEDSAT